MDVGGADAGSVDGEDGVLADGRQFQALAAHRHVVDVKVRRLVEPRVHRVGLVVGRVRRRVARHRRCQNQQPNRLDSTHFN